MADGKFINLWQLFGYFKAAPVNLTDKEAKGRGPGPSMLDTASWYHSNTNPSGDHSAHLDEMDEMSKFEFIQPIIDLYAEEACLTADAEIPMLDGTTKTIGELFDQGVEKGWVYGYDPQTDRPVACCFESVQKVGEQCGILKISYRDSKGVVGHLKVTPEHKFLALDGKYVKAADLVVGDRLTGLIRHQYKSHGQTYESVFSPAHREWQSTHRMVLGSLGVEIPEGSVVHHKNHVSCNNVPSNLEMMTEEAHRALHDMRGERNPRFRADIQWPQVGAALSDGFRSFRETRTKLKCGAKVLTRVLRERGYKNWSDIKSRLFGLSRHSFGQAHKAGTHERYEALHPQLVAFGLEHPEAPFIRFREHFGPVMEEVIKYFGYTGWNDFREKNSLPILQHKKPVNHTIISIEECPREDVYDLVNSMPTHNFAAGNGGSWVFVKNTQPDTSNGKTVWYECNDPGIEKSLNKMLDDVNIDDAIYGIAFDIAAKGNVIRRVLRTEDGVNQLTPMDLKEVARVWEPTTRRLIGFDWKGQQPNEGDGIKVKEQKLFAPWEFLHFRRIGRSTSSENGDAIVEHLFPIYRKIKMAVDAMMIYRMHTMPNRLCVYIDTGTQTVSEAMETVNLFRNHFRSSLALDGNRSFEARHNAPAFDSMMFLPMPKDSQTKIEPIPGDKDVPDVPDLKLLFNMLFGAARVPKAYLGFDEDSGGLAKASLVTQDMRFARMIRVLRRPMVVGFHRLAQLHIAFTGKNPANYRVKVHMSKICALEEEVKATMMEKQASMASQLIGICQLLSIPNKDIVELVFREILHLPSNFVNVAKLAMSVQQAVGAPGQGQDGMGGPPMGGPPMGGVGPGGDLGADLGLGPTPGPDGSAFSQNPADQGAGDSQTAQAGPTNAQMSSMFGPTGNKLMETAFASFAEGLRTLTEDSKVLTEARLHSWDIMANLREYYAIRATGKTSLVEADSARTRFSDEALPGEAVTASGLAKTGQTLAEAHPAVQIARATRKS